MRYLNKLLLPSVAILALSLWQARSAQAIPPPTVPKEGTVALFGADVAEGKPLVFRDDADAYTGHYVSPNRKYQVLASITPPAVDAGSLLHVWIRYRGLALQMKRKDAGKTHEFPWNWARHADGFQWRKVGIFPRSDLGEQVYFMCDTSWSETSGIDALVITADEKWTPPGVKAAFSTVEMPDAANATVRVTPIVPEESSEPGEARVRIQWDHTIRAVEPLVYSLNTPNGANPEKIASPAWHKATAYMGAPLLRLHTGGLVKGWYLPEKDDWDYAKIRAALTNGTPPEGVVRMININTWPAEYDADQDRRLDPGRVADFARLCADLVRFVNTKMKANVLYWEVTNEKDFAYWRTPSPGLEPDVAALAHLYNETAAAMRAVDPLIKIGGPAACSPLPVEPLIQFAQLTHKQLDFLSFHHYASGTNTESDQTIYEKAFIMADDAARVIRRLNKALPSNKIEVHLNEFNICYTWKVPEPRMRNYKGAVFDALSLIAYAQVRGLTATNAWNDMDTGTYGKLDREGNLRPSAYVYHYFNQILRGMMVGVTTSQGTSVVPFAVLNGEGHLPAFVLVNRTNAIQTVTLEGAAPALSGSGWQVASVGANGYYPAMPAKPYDSPIDLDPHSVHFYWVN